MFKEIKYIGSYIYRLKDTDFDCQLVAIGYGTAHIIASVAIEYENRGLPVPGNIAQLLIYLYPSIEDAARLVRILQQHAACIDADKPRIEFGKRYCRCIRNQLMMRRFAKFGTR